LHSNIRSIIGDIEVPESLDQEQDNLAVDSSWDFLPKITQQVLSMPFSVQESILHLGDVLNQRGVVYVHQVFKSASNSRGVKAKDGSSVKL
jgi:hypothetical protein